TERMEAPPISPNQVGSMVTQAIQQQTDRLLAELRHQQMPPSMTVMFPPFPATERVGIFVDVANLLYSSRSMRISLDFGRLLDFLRGNRQLKRAHAYAPTNPDPNAEQSFLSVVKGLGYRITTKNYKTFSSGAKKADLDLDMCMDIVRLVDSGAVDTVVLVSGDSDFLPLLEYCSDKGVRVEVAAFDDSAAMILRQSCDLFINLSLVDDIRA
ncbi:MAG: LabA-like NYN domain-containing protein, partial [Ktedonobacterales bacterium]